MTHDKTKVNVLTSASEVVFKFIELHYAGWNNSSHTSWIVYMILTHSVCYDFFYRTMLCVSAFLAAARCLSIRLSVTLVCCMIVSRWLKISSILFPDPAAQYVFLFFFLTQAPLPDFKGNLSARALYTREWEYFAIFDWNRRFSHKRYEIGSFCACVARFVGDSWVSSVRLHHACTGCATNIAKFRTYKARETGEWRSLGSSSESMFFLSIPDTDQPECSACHCPLTVKHFLIECRALTSTRNKHLGYRFFNDRPFLIMLLPETLSILSKNPIFMHYLMLLPHISY